MSGGQEPSLPPAVDGAGNPVFVARQRGSWLLTPVTGGLPQPVDLGAVIDLVLSSTSEGGSPSGGSEDAAIPPWSTVVAYEVIVGRVSRGGWTIHDADGDAHTLDIDHLRLLDAIGEAASVDEIRAVGGATVDAMLRELVRSGAVRLDTQETGIPPEANESARGLARHEPAAEAEPAPRGLLASLRRVLPRRASPAATLPSTPDAPMEPEPTAQAPSVEAEPAVEAEPEAPVEVAPAEPLEDSTPIDGRIPVYAVWYPSTGPLLSLGMLTAAARSHDGGALNEIYDIRRPELQETMLADLARRTGPAVLLCSDYNWSIEQNFEVARRAKEINPELVVLHGGPCSPKYEADAERFMDDYGHLSDILARGEGEHLLVEVLTSLAASLPELDVATLSGIEGLTFRDPESGKVIRTPDRVRTAVLDDLPSPYLTGEFDGIDPDAWLYNLSIETNRGCPYGCTFCDWGSATMSRVRKFDIERVTREVEWAASRGVTTILITDANFGIMARDVEIAERIAAVKRSTAAGSRIGAFEAVVYYPAKNTTRHLLKIMDVFADAGISSISGLALQTTDPDTLEALARSNISTDHYVALAASIRRRGHAVQGDLLLGSPGQTYDSYRLDLQFMFDHEMFKRSWPVQMLVNAPMNDPDYRERHRIVSDEDHLIVSTASFTEADRDRMFRLRQIDSMFEQFGLLRHVLRWLQWDHQIPATEVMDHVLDITELTPGRFPHLTWIVNYYDLIPAPPVGWSEFYGDVRSMIEQDYGISASSAMDCALAVNQFLMPAANRQLPDSIQLEHDYVAHYQSVTEELYRSGHVGTPVQPLAEYPPAVLTVSGDPLGLCVKGLHFEGDSRSQIMQGDFAQAVGTANELLSPLLRLLPAVTRMVEPEVVLATIGYLLPTEPVDALPDDDDTAGNAVAVRLGRAEPLAAAAD